MRKLYVLMTFALLFWGLGVSWARPHLVEGPKTSFAAGDEILLHSKGKNWLSGAAQVPVGAYFTDDFAFILEASGKTNDGHPAFYLKQKSTGTYLRNERIFSEEDEYQITMTPTASEATPFSLVRALDYYDQNKTVPGDTLTMIMLNDSLFLNHYNDGSLFAATYNDYATWFTAYASDSYEDAEEEFDMIMSETESWSFKAGTNPGCYPANLVAIYDIAKENALAIAYKPGATPAEKLLVAKDLRAAFEDLKPQVVPMAPGYYRIVSGLAGFYEKQGVRKSIFVNAANEPVWGNLDSLEINQVWHVEALDGEWYSFRNLGTNEYLKDLRMGPTEPIKIKINSFNSNARFSLDPQGKYSLHANNHGGGGGVSSNLVYYNADALSASAWCIEAIEADKLEDFIATSQQMIVNKEMAILLQRAEAKYDLGAKYNANTSVALITDTTQITSNASQNQWGSKDGGGYAALLDKADSTYFHSCWQKGPAAYHYLQFALNAPVQKFAFAYTRRNQKSNANRPTLIEIYATNDSAGVWNKVKTISSGLPTDSLVPSYLSNGVELEENYKYIRFVVLKTNNGDLLNGYPYFTFSEFQLHPTTLDPNSQIGQMGQAGTDFLNAILAARRVSQVATRADIEALQTAYDNFIGYLADPTSLSDMIASANETVKKSFVTENADPGTYSQDDVDVLNEAIALAEAYIDGEEYTKEGIAAEVEKLNAAINTLKAKARKVETGKWYYISCAQKYYTLTETTPIDGRTGSMYATDGFEALEKGAINYKETEQGNTDFMWRFVALTDTTYAIQNRTSGLYIGESRSGNHVGLSMTPVAYKPQDLSCASFLLIGSNLNGSKINPLHSQIVGNVVVYWGDTSLGGGSCWDIEYAGEDVEEEYFTVRQNLQANRLYAMTYPTEISGCATELYQLAGTTETTVELKSVSTVPAGEPFFIITGDIVDYNETPTADDSLLVEFDLTDQIATAPKTVNGLVGTFYGAKVFPGVGQIEPTGVVAIAGTDSVFIGKNTAYIHIGLIKTNEAGDISVPLTGLLIDGVKDMIIANKEIVDVYTTTGILVRKSVKASGAVSGLPKGIYIVGGKKATVK